MKLLYSILIACTTVLYAQMDGSVYSLYKSPFTDQEAVAPDQFQDAVIRAARAKKMMNDISVSQNHRDFARAAYYYYSGQWDSAYAAYNSLRGREPGLTGSVILRMAQADFKQERYAKMRETLRLEKNLESDKGFREAADRLRIKATMADFSINDAARADSLMVFLENNPDGEDIVPLKYRYARYLEDSYQLKQAKRLYMKLLTSKSSYKDSAFASIRRLREVLGTPESLAEKVAYAKMACTKDEMKNCLSLLDSIQIMDAQQAQKNPALVVPLDDPAYARLKKSTLDLNTRINLWEKRAGALRALNRNEDAIEQYRYLIENVEPRPGWIQNILKLYRKESAELFDDEIRMYDSLLQDVSQYSTENANNLWLRGFEFEQKLMYDKAVECYMKLVHKRFKNNIKRQWARFRIGYVYFKRGMWVEAAANFREATKEPFTWSGSASRMFLGDTYMKMHEDSLAREAYLDCIKDFPLSYYAHRSRMKLSENNLMAVDQIPYAHGVQMSPATTLDWIRSVNKLGKPDPSYSKDRYERIKKLFIYGFEDDAFRLYDEVKKKNYKRLDFLYEYGKLFYDMGETAAGYRLARQFQAKMDRRLFMAPPIDVLHYLYPVPYADPVVYYSGNNIDPFFVYSVMRQESIFDFQITSPAGACGLLQIMPATGKMLADKEEVPNFEPKRLYNAYLNIRLGIRYLVDLKDDYRNDYMYVLCNYNAGPKPTRRWQSQSEGLPWDLRVEEISYWETREYVKRVMGNYWIYKEIYDNSDVGIRN
jgi:Soluble lytic murein transglycosylase and related regulatory proteins (some contain LysM/invasin domains)